MDPIVLRSIPPSNAELRRRALNERHKDWQVWYVESCVGRGTIWCARPDPFGPHRYVVVLNANSAEDLSKYITEIENAWKEQESSA